MANRDFKNVKRMVSNISEDTYEAAEQGGEKSNGTNLYLYTFWSNSEDEENKLNVEDITKFEIDGVACTFEYVKDVENLITNTSGEIQNTTGKFFIVKGIENLDVSAYHTLAISISNNNNRYKSTTRFRIVNTFLYLEDYEVFWYNGNSFEWYGNFGQEKTINKILLPTTLMIHCCYYNPK